MSRVNNPSPLRCIIIVTCDDEVTKRMSKASHGIDRVFADAGYDVTCLRGDVATFETIRQCMKESNSQGRPYTTAMIVSHGCDDGIVSRKSIILDPATCRFFKEAIVVLCSCMASGEFPERITSQPTIGGSTTRSVRLAMGYKPRLKVLPRRSGLTDLEQVVLSEVVHMHAECAASGDTANLTKSKIQETWRKAIKMLPVPDREFGLMFWENMQNICTWPKVCTK